MADRVRPAVLLLVVLLASCAGPTVPLIDRDAPPVLDRPGLETQPDPVPRWEPAARAGNRSPYIVFGETYHVLPSAAGFVDEGDASWYGRKFHGRATSNGERYDMFSLTAAHKHLPLPTWLRVTHLGNGRSIIVRVNDRGPFHGDRIIDLSYGAAVKLGFHEDGVARVRIEAITPARPGTEPLDDASADGVADVQSALTTAQAGASEIRGAIWLQAGAFGDREGAERLHGALSDLLGDDAARVHMDATLEGITRVRIGPFSDLDEAGRVQALITFADVVGVPLIVRD